MARNFHDDATQFMTDLLKLLRSESNSANLGESLQGEESAFSVLLRLVGVENNVVLDIEGAENKEVSADNAPNLVDNFFKIQNGATADQLTKLNRLLKAYKKRLTRYSKSRVLIKLNRVKKLVEPPEELIDSRQLVKSTPEQTRKEVALRQKELQESGEVTGIVDQTIALHQALDLSVNATVNLPTDSGAFASQLRKLTTAISKDSTDTIDRLTRFKDDIQNEVTRLENTDKLLFEGAETFSTANQLLSLLNVLDVLIFLTDRQQIKYNCSECKFFRTGQTDVCIFAGKGAISNTPLVEIIDENSNKIVGRQTSPTNSCKQVWGLDSNEYHTPSDSVKDAIRKILKE